jgi:hypothetical protein
MMVGLLVVLAQEIFAVVVAIGRANHDMDVVPVGLLVLRERLTSLVVKLDNDNRALDTVVKHVVCFDSAHPGKIGPLEMPLYLFHLCRGVTGADAADVNFNQAD